jgi:hypothetical protein
MGTPPIASRRQQGVLIAATYLLLFLLGAVQGVVGSFQYARDPVPFVAIGLDLVIFATCVLAGWGLRTLGAGMWPAVGWIVAAFVLAMPSGHGSVIITNTAAGKWYLYGGALAAAAGASTSFTAWARSRSRR